ncbi:hypothetical protein BGW80DRAFT_1560401 [Lactifluus volemus]|nr:hypothetical protein BGW80DRAFT_1560401 [Lactifluus volemus]
MAVYLDGRCNANSPAQQALVDAYIGEDQIVSPDERSATAERVWRSEKAQAMTIINLGWLLSFISRPPPSLSNYRSLPLSQPSYARHEPKRHACKRLLLTAPCPLC